MFDCGEGTVRQLMNSSVRASKIDSVFITHLHGDHVSVRMHLMLVALIAYACIFTVSFTDFLGWE